MEFKKCSKCGELKPLEEFHKDQSHKDGHKNICKKCLSVRKTIKINSKVDRNVKQSLIYSLKHNGPFRWSVVLGYDGDDIRNHFLSLFDETMNFDNYGKVWCASFFIPRRCYYFNSIKDDNFRKFWSLKNLKPVLIKDALKQKVQIKKSILNKYSLWDIVPNGNIAYMLVD